MGKIVIATNATLDGFVQDPDGQEGAKHGGWFRQFGGKDLDAWTKLETEEAFRGKALLLGRRTDEWFASRWSSRTGEWADRLNEMPKYVVSSTRKASAWRNGTVLAGDLATEVATLKQRVDGDILVYASYQLGQALMDLVLFPVVLGEGSARLFGTTRDKRPFRLMESRLLGEGLVYVTYQRAS